MCLACDHEAVAVLKQQGKLCYTRAVDTTGVHVASTRYTCVYMLNWWLYHMCFSYLTKSRYPAAVTDLQPTDVVYSSEVQLSDLIIC